LAHALFDTLCLLHDKPTGIKTQNALKKAARPNIVMVVLLVHLEPFSLVQNPHKPGLS
jgi:hypothetical protein